MNYSQQLDEMREQEWNEKDKMREGDGKIYKVRQWVEQGWNPMWFYSFGAGIPLAQQETDIWGQSKHVRLHQYTHTTIDWLAGTHAQTHTMWDYNTFTIIYI